MKNAAIQATPMLLPDMLFQKVFIFPIESINQKTFPLPDSFRLHNQLPTNLIHKVKIK